MGGTVTVVFTDLVGSTELAGALGPERADVVRRGHFADLSAAVTSCGGEVVKNLGDGLMVVFRSAADGIAGAVAAQRAVAIANRRPRPSGETDFAIRVGVSVGDATTEDGDWFGPPVVEAARLCAAAAGGQILVHDVVRLLAGGRGDHAMASLGPMALKGLGEVEVCEVAWMPAGGVGGGRLPPALASDGGPFVGREGERNRLVDAARAVVTDPAGGLQLALVAGEPGVGKTRLASEVATVLVADGTMVVLGRCPEEAVIGYQPFSEVLRYVATCLGPELVALAGPRSVAELGRIVPDIRDLVGDLPEQFRGEPDAERFALFEAVAQVLRAVATTAPLLLVLDDLHWADGPSLSLLRHLVGHQEAVPAFAIATYRDTEVRRTHPLAELLADLRRRSSIHRVDLSGLGSEDVVGMLEAMAGHELDDDGRRLAVLLQRETEGNPFFLGEIVRHLVETGMLREVEGRWVADRDVAQLPIPEGVKEVVGRRLSRLSEEANRLLAVAAVLGREFDATVVAELVHASLEEVVEGLESALAARLLDEVPGTLERYSFSHALVRETLHGELSTSRRVRLHQRAADVLERQGAPAADIARHLRESAPAVGAERAALACLAAARDSIAAAAAEDAIAHCAAAVGLLDDDGTGPSRLRFDLALVAADSWYRLGDLSMAKPNFESAVAQARILGDPELVAHAIFERYGRIPSDDPADWRERRSLQLSALESLPEGDTPGRAKLLSLLATTVMQYPEDPNGPTWAQEGVAVARRCGDTLAVGFALWVSQCYLSPSPDIDARMALAHEAVTSVATVGHITGMWQAAEARGALLFEGGRMDLVHEHVANLSRSAEELRVPILRISLAYWDFLFAILAGDLPAAHAADSSATEIAASSSLSGEALFAGLRAFALAREEGTLEALVPAIVMYADAFPNLLGWRAGLAWAHAELGRLEEARAAVKSVVESGLDRLPFDPLTWLVGCVLLADISSWLDEPEWAEAIENHLIPHSGHVAHVGWAEDCWGSVDHHLGRLSLVRGRFDEAEARFRAGLELEERIGAVVWAARTREQLAVAVEARGDAVEARALREAALAVAERVPSPRLVERLRSALG